MSKSFFATIFYHQGKNALRSGHLGRFMAFETDYLVLATGRYDYRSHNMSAISFSVA
jgi:hypothetical protein